MEVLAGLFKKWPCIFLKKITCFRELFLNHKHNNNYYDYEYWAIQTQLRSTAYLYTKLLQTIINFIILFSYRPQIEMILITGGSI